MGQWWPWVPGQRPSFVDSGTPDYSNIRITVLGDCGMHASIEEWQKCPTCGAILKSRLQPHSR